MKRTPFKSKPKVAKPVIEAETAHGMLLKPSQLGRTSVPERSKPKSKVAVSPKGKKALWSAFIAKVSNAVWYMQNIDVCELDCGRNWPLTSAHSRRRSVIPVGDYYYGFRTARICEPEHKQIDANKRDETEAIIERVIAKREGDWVQMILQAVEAVHAQDDKKRFAQFVVTAEDLTPTSFERKTIK